MKILVTGATGTVGTEVAEQLYEQGHAVRALVRNPAKADLPDGIDVVTGDLTEPDDVRRALTGMDRAFLNMADDDGAAFASVAGEMNLQHVALLSSFTVSVRLPSGPDNIVTARHATGERLLSEAGVPATFLRAAGFDYNVLLWAESLSDGVVRTPFPDVRLPVVHPGDIAACAAAALSAEKPPVGVFSITGPEPLSTRDQVRTLSELTDRPVSVEQMTIQEAVDEAFPAGTPQFVSMSVLETLGLGGQAAALPVSDDVAVLTGQPPRDFRQWAAENLASFG
jgi:uncharacterized protein YbjT (DUF2867 family)